MVFARTAAMLFNRLVDWSLDQRNARTATRHLLDSEILSARSSGRLLAWLLVLRVRHQSNDGRAGNPCVADHFLLLGHKTFHERYAFFSRPRARDCASRRLVAQTGKFALPPLILGAWSDLLGRRVRFHLRHAGL